jgi:hypothetical protein
MGLWKSRNSAGDWYVQTHEPAAQLVTHNPNLRSLALDNLGSMQGSLSTAHHDATIKIVLVLARAILDLARGLSNLKPAAVVKH